VKKKISIGREDVHPQNGLNRLILNWWIGGCWFTPAHFLRFGTDYNVCTYTHLRELMKSVGEEWQVVPAIYDEVMVCYFLRTLIRSWLHSFLSCSFWVCQR